MPDLEPPTDKGFPADTMNPQLFGLLTTTVQASMAFNTRLLYLVVVGGAVNLLIVAMVLRSSLAIEAGRFKASTTANVPVLEATDGSEQPRAALPDEPESPEASGVESSAGTDPAVAPGELREPDP